MQDVWIEIGAIEDIPRRGARRRAQRRAARSPCSAPRDDEIFALIDRCPASRRAAVRRHRLRQRRSPARCTIGSSTSPAARRWRPMNGCAPQSLPVQAASLDAAAFMSATAARSGRVTRGDGVAQRCAPPVPIAASAAACWRCPTARPSGDPDHPANFGRLCSKGAALGDTLALAGRLLRPQLDGRGACWDAGAGRSSPQPSRAPSTQHGPEAVAFYVSGQFLTEDYYVANKLMKGFIGAANIDTNSRLCMASSVAGHVRAFGEDVVPGCLRGSGAGRSRRPGRQQHGLVPSGALSSG